MSDDFEARHDRGRGGRFVSMPRDEVPLDLSGSYPDMATRMAPVGNSYRGGSVGESVASESITLVDEDGERYVVEARTTRLVVSQCETMTIEEWNSTGPVELASGIPELDPDVDDDDELEEYLLTPDEFVIRRVDSHRDQLSRKYAGRGWEAISEAVERRRAQLEGARFQSATETILSNGDREVVIGSHVEEFDADDDEIAHGDEYRTSVLCTVRPEDHLALLKEWR